MSISLRLLISALVGLIGTATLAVGSLLILMMQNTDVGTRAEGLFGSVYFESVAIDAERFTMNVGIADPMVLLIIAAALAVFTFLFLTIHRALRSYRQHVMAT